MKVLTIFLSLVCHFLVKDWNDDHASTNANFEVAREKDMAGDLKMLEA